MGIIGKQTIKATFFTYSGIVLGFITVGLLMPKVLTTTQNGLIGLLISYSVIVANVAQLGFGSATVRYFHVFRNTAKQHHGFLSLSIIIFFCGWLLFSTLLWLAQDFIVFSSQKQSSLFADYFWMLPVLVALQMLFTVFDNYARVLYDAVTGMFLKELVLRLPTLLGLVAYWQGWISFHVFTLIWLLGFLLPTSLMILKVRADGQFFLKTEFEFLTPDLRKDLLVFSAYSFLFSISGILMFHIEPIYISKFLGLSDTGIYRITSVFGMVIVAPARMLYRISGVVIADAWHTNDIEKIKLIYHKSSLNQFVIGGLAFIGIVCNLHNVMSWLPSDYAKGIWVIVWYGLSGLVEMITGTNTLILGASRYFKVELYFVLLFLLSSVLFSAWLIPLWGLTGCAVASFISISILNIARCLMLWLKFDMNPFSKQHLHVMLIMGSLLVVNSLIQHLSVLWLDLLCRSGVLFCGYVWLTYKLRISTDFNKQVDWALQKMYSLAK